MSQAVAMLPTDFVDRRGSGQAADALPSRERRQFTNSHEDLSPDARELADAIDRYKLMHRRRFITYEEMLTVIGALGYSKDEVRRDSTLFG
jgi:hypothetical protein